MCPRPSARFVCVSALLFATCLAAAARGAEALRWGLAPGDCLLIACEQSGEQTYRLCPRNTGVRTLFGAELRDGRRIATAPGRMVDLIYRYVTWLPEKRVGRRARWQVHEVHPHLEPQDGGTIEVEGRGEALRRGKVYVIEHALQLRARAKGAAAATGGMRKRFVEGNLQTRLRFYRRKGLFVDAHVAFSWVDDKGTRHAFEATLTPKALLRADGGALEREVDAAIERALDKRLRPYLARKAWRTVNAQKLGHLALMLYAAFKAGLEPTDPVAREALAEIESVPWEETYSVALALLALEASGMKRTRPRGGGGLSRARYRKEPLDDAHQRLLARLARWLIEAQLPGGDWSYKSAAAERKRGRALAGGDNSNTQFAVLGLHAARRSEVPVPPEVWVRVAKHFLASLSRDGPPTALAIERGGDAVPGDPHDGLGPMTVARGRGMAVAESGARARGAGYNRWAAAGAAQQYASMTAAAVSSMLIAHKWLVEARREPKLVASLRSGIRDGYAWLQRFHDMRHNWPHQGWTYYHLYSLEKAFELGRVERIGGHDWWAEGARELLLREDAQRGGWGTDVETALAVLFLTRASAEPELEIDPIERAQTGGPERAQADDAVAIDGVGVVRVSELIAACATRDAAKRRERLALLDRAWALLEPEYRPLCVPALATALEGRYREVSRRARRLLEEVVGRRVETREDAMAFHAQWQTVRALGKRGGAEAIAELRARLQPSYPRGIRYAAALWLSRLRALEAVPDLIGMLQRARTVEHRRYLHRLLISIAGTDPGYDPAAGAAERARGIERWQAWYERVRKEDEPAR